MNDLPRYYVYTLTDPRDGEVFYVGKGTGNRLHQHESDCRRGVVSNGAKHLRIRGILDAGMQVRAEIIESDLTEDEALRNERRLIGEYGFANLTNIMPGQHGVLEQLVAVAEEGIRRHEYVLALHDAGHKFPPGWIEATRGWLISLRRIIAKYPQFATN